MTAPRLVGNPELVSALPHPQRLADALGGGVGFWCRSQPLSLSSALLRKLLGEVLRRLPFDEAYYLAANPDIADRYRAGEIVNPHRHFLDTGWFEGRLGAPPAFDAAFYLATYPDVAAAIEAGQLELAEAHYLGQGLREGRVGAPALLREALEWTALLDAERGLRVSAPAGDT